MNSYSIILEIVLHQIHSYQNFQVFKLIIYNFILFLKLKDENKKYQPVAFKFSKNSALLIFPFSLLQISNNS